MPRVAIVLGVLVAGCGCGFALNPSLDITQYAHNAWTVRDGFFKGPFTRLPKRTMGISG